VAVACVVSCVHLTLSCLGLLTMKLNNIASKVHNICYGGGGECLTGVECSAKAILQVKV